ncbi:major membrane immunogen [Treponema primitia]|uniref:FMN-binding protein n=1 Tax=Treponema primitia TaxID=88058 RepID=UPI00025556F0|nr:major membrane immunogen [Treponema primitia]
MIFSSSAKGLLFNLFVSLLLVLGLSACSVSESGGDKLQDGYFTAAAAEFDANGWKECITIYIDNNRIVTVEYNAKNASGFLKSWDMEYMRQMSAVAGNYPTKYTRVYAQALLNRQDPDKIDALAGATHSYKSFKVLARAVIDQARAGDKKVALVELSD